MSMRRMRDVGFRLFASMPVLRAFDSKVRTLRFRVEGMGDRKKIDAGYRSSELEFSFAALGT